MIGLIASTQSFYFATLEEYYTGGLYLGVGNGVTDGSVLIMGIFIYCGLVGNAFCKALVPITIGNLQFEI